MSDRRAVTAGRLGAPSVAGEMWRVAVGGNRVENMTVQEIAHAYQSGHLNERTPLWPPGTSGWQALGNFQQFQYASGAHAAMASDPYQGGQFRQEPYRQDQYAQGQYSQGQYQQLSQFQESDDDPTRMWTGAGDLEIDMPAPMAVAPAPIPSAPPPARPSARTGPRPVSSLAPRPMSAPPAHVQRAVSSAPTASPSVPPFRAKRSSGWLLVAGLVGLVGLGSAVLAARGNWTSAAIMQRFSSSPAPEATAQAPAAAPAEATPAPAAAEPASAAAAAPAEPSAAGEAAPGVNGVAKYEESGASAFVAGAEPGKTLGAGEAGAEGDTTASGDDAKAESQASIASTSRRSRSAKESSKSQPAPKRSLSSKTSTQNAKRATAALTAKSKQEPSESDEASPPAASTPASPSVNEAAAAALANSAKLASSCRPRGGPSGAGKARIIYSQDGEVQSVEILTAKFRDTLTGSCVRMVFRRAKIPPFKGEPPTFIKSFTIPEE